MNEAGGGAARERGMICGADPAHQAGTPRRPRFSWHAAALTLVALAWLAPGAARAQPADPPSASASDDPVFIPDLSGWLPAARSRESLSSTLQIFVLLTVLTVLPSIVLMMTCFVRMLTVLALLRMALGTQTLPPSQVLVALALFMTALAMAPTWERIRATAVNPYLEGHLPQTEAIARAAGELRAFMFDQIEASRNEQDVYMMYEYAARRSVPQEETLSRESIPITALVPAYLLSELKTAFIIGFRIYLPFLVIDMVIATVLVAMGMMMLPPVLISMPFKLLLFVLADGWHLVAGSLLASVIEAGGS
jgi:flagellar biosynthetic protein FliP